MPGSLIFLGGLGRATVLAVVGFFVLFTASKSQGLVKRIGNVLGAWLFVLAVLAIVGSIFLGAMGRGFMGPHHPWMHAAAPGVVAQPPAANSTAQP